MQKKLRYDSLPPREHLAQDASALALPFSVEIRQGLIRALGNVFDEYVVHADCSSIKELHDLLICDEHGLPNFDGEFTIDILDANEEADI